MIEAIFWDNDGILVETEHLDFRPPGTCSRQSASP